MATGGAPLRLSITAAPLVMLTVTLAMTSVDNSDAPAAGTGLNRLVRIARAREPLGPRSLLISQQPIHVCSSMDVRNSLVDVQELSRCDVIEGSLRVVVAGQLIEHNITFPKLVQVTDYVMFYRVKGLRTFANIFPNLTVIRGYRLFHGFALVVYENSQLESLGLLGLRRILRGNVRVEKNGRLCYLRTVDWQAITQRSDAIVLENKEPGLLESSGDAGWYQIDRTCTMQECPGRCGGFVRDDRRLRACWDHSHCQIFTDRFECDPLCVGGCYKAGSASHCVACRHVQLGLQCYERCPSGTYLYEGWRCVTQEECLTFPTDHIVDESGGNVTNSAQTRSQFHIAFNGSCLTQCPAGYMPTEAQRSCEKCKDECLKSCSVRRISSATQVQRLKGCNIIDGPLHIQVSGESIVSELEENLSGVRVIRDYLRVSHSEPLVSLHFLRNLQKIEGRNLLSGRYSLYFLHNHNLQTLWPNSTQLTVDNGLPFFHFNHKLCLDKITATVARLGMPSGDVVDIGQMTNGDKVPCRRETLMASVPIINSTSVVISWQSFADNVTDFRNLLGYNLFYRQTDSRNLTLYDGRSACSHDVWQVLDLAAWNQTRGRLFEAIQGLKPFTQYAYYVETLMVNIGANATTAQSPIQYFTTSPTNPTKPRKLRVFALSDSELRVQWSRPLHANGNVTHYRVVVVLSPLPRYADLASINVCSRKPDVFNAGVSKSTTTTTTTTLAPGIGGNSSILGGLGVDSAGGQCCSCQKNKGGSAEGGGLRTIKHEQILFEDMMQNTLFVKNRGRSSVGSVRVTRNVPDVVGTDPSTNVITVSGAGGESRVGDGDWSTPDLPPESPLPICSNNTFIQRPCVALSREYRSTVSDPQSVVLSGLDYFREYTVEVIACQTPPLPASSSASTGVSEPPDVGLCSVKAIASHQTLPREKADMLVERPTVSNSSANGSVLISWLDPPTPNGYYVLQYIVHTHRVNGDSSELSSSKLVCPLLYCSQPPCRRFKRMTLPSGNISVQIQAKTLAGYGPLSQPVYYLVTAVSSGLSVGEIVLIVVALLLMTGLMFVALLVYRRHLMPKNPLYSSSNPYYGNDDMVPYLPDEWEVDPERVCFERMLAQGSFGTVYVGTALLISDSAQHLDSSADIDGDTATISSKQTEAKSAGHLQRVAIKTLHATAHLSDRHAFLAEASIMKQYDCHHVVRLLAIVSSTRGGSRSACETTLPVPDPPYVIMELMTAGDLRSYLRLKRPDAFEDSMSPDQFVPVMPEVYLMALQIADGMAYLSHVNSVHRDLAARNCMVTASDTGGVVVKIGDFGMTRDLYEKDYYKKGDKGLLPVRWMGPESLRDGVFTSQSDVWSYGVVLWEMATYAAQPYQGLTNKQVMTHVLAGHRLTRPVGCPQLLYDLMTNCWQFKSSERPTFINLVEQLLHCADAAFSVTSFYHSDRKKSSGDASGSHGGRRAKLASQPPDSRPPEHVLRPLMARSESLSSEEKIVDAGDGGGNADAAVRDEDASVEMSALLPPSVSYRNARDGNGRVADMGTVPGSSSSSSTPAPQSRTTESVDV